MKPQLLYVEVVNDFLHGQTIQSIRQFINRPFVCARIQSPGGPIRSPGPDTEVFKGDVLRIVSESEHKAGIVAFFGKEALGVDLQIQHSPIHSETVLVTDPKVNGLKISDLHLSHYDGLNITRLFRAGMELFPTAASICSSATACALWGRSAPSCALRLASATSRTNSTIRTSSRSSWASHWAFLPASCRLPSPAFRCR